MNKDLHPLRSVPSAVLLGSVLISVSILLHGGIIKVGNVRSSAGSLQPTASSIPQAANQPSGQKTEAQMVERLKFYATKLSLDKGKFDSCLDASQKADLVNSDYSEGLQAGVEGTPAFFLNGYPIYGAQPYSVFKDAIAFLIKGGDFSSPDDSVRYLVDGKENNGEVSKNKVTVGAGSLPFLGNSNAPVTLVEFSDYQCPYCGRFYSTSEKQLIDELVNTGKVKFYYRDFPLSQIHIGAQKGAEAARCAGDQGRYWQYHDLIFENQTDIF